MSKRIKILQIVGARPQIIKSAALQYAVDEGYKGQIELLSLHTGQHFDRAMSEVFYKEMGIRPADIQLDAGEGTHAEQTASIMLSCEAAFKMSRPDAVLVYGDTNSTLASALAAYHAGIPVIHVEAGLRSFNKLMPEECNRLAADHVSSLLFVPSKKALELLAKEGIAYREGPCSTSHPKVIDSGDLMYDNSLRYAGRSYTSPALNKLDLDRDFILATCHRPSNTDDPQVLEGIFDCLANIATEQCRVILPVHPRLKKHAALLTRYQGMKNLILTEPMSFLEMTQLESKCSMVITDSGGVQKEAFYFKKPCIVMREETEWTELVTHGNAILCGNNPARIKAGVKAFEKKKLDFPDFYGTGDSGKRICASIIKYLG